MAHPSSQAAFAILTQSLRAVAVVGLTIFMVTITNVVGLWAPECTSMQYKIPLSPILVSFLHNIHTARYRWPSPHNRAGCRHRGLFDKAWYVGFILCNPHLVVGGGNMGLEPQLYLILEQRLVLYKMLSCLSFAPDALKKTGCRNI